MGLFSSSTQSRLAAVEPAPITGPLIAMRNLEKVFETHDYESEFDVPALSGYFTALLSWRMTLERQCAVRPEPTPAEISAHAATIVDDFMKAFLRSR